MSVPRRRIGCDVSKSRLDLFDSATGKAFDISNTRDGIEAFLATLPADAVVVFEATSPMDNELRRALTERGLEAYRINPAQGRNYARANLRHTKTDKIDAKLLADMFGRIDLIRMPPFDAAREALCALHRRRDQLVEMRATDKGRLKSETDAYVRKSLVAQVSSLDRQIKKIEAEMAKRLDAPRFKSLVALLRSIKGVGDVTVATIAALMPELGTLTAKAITSLAGLAPFNHDSGMMKGQRAIGGGRRRVRRALYMAALSAIRRVPTFKDFYRALKERGKKPKVAIIAVARKLLVTLNAMVKSAKPFRAQNALC